MDIMKRITILLAVCLCVLPLVGCATQTTAIKDVFVSGMEKGYPVLNVIHAERAEKGLHLQLGPDETSLIKLSLGSDEYILNWTIAPLGEDSFLWEHVSSMGAIAGSVDADIFGRTLIRVDQPAYLGPLQR